MSSEELSATGIELIKKYLQSTYIHYTATEIYEFFNDLASSSSTGLPFTKSTIRSYLKNLANTSEIQSETLEGKRDKCYFANKILDVKYINLEIIGFYIQNPDPSKLLESVREKLTDNETPFSPTIASADDKRIFLEEPDQEVESLLSDNEKLQHIAFFQGVGMINYFDIPKIVGINPFRREKGKSPIGIQRPREKDWIQKLKIGLSAKYSTILTNSILYFKKENIEEIEPIKIREDELYNWKIRVPYQEHVFDYEKPGYILDGQQRMWALDLINLERVFKFGNPANPYYGPATVLIGDFGDEEEYEMEVIRLYFILANNTKNLPPKLREELASLMKSEVSEALPTAIRSKMFIEKMVELLDSEKISPFYQLIDHDVKAFHKLGKIDTNISPPVQYFARGGVNNIIITILKGNPFNYDSKDSSQIEIIEKNHIRWTHMIIDYFNAIKCVFNREWNEVGSVIKRNIGLNALGTLISLIWTHNLNRINRISRVKELIKYFTIWKIFDGELDLSSESEININIPKDKKEEAKNLYGSLKKTWIDSTREPADSDEVKEQVSEAEAIWEEIKDEAGVEGDNF